MTHLRGCPNSRFVSPVPRRLMRLQSSTPDLATWRSHDLVTGWFPHSGQRAERSEVEVQVFRLEANLLRQLVDRLFQTHQRQADALDFVRRQRALLDAAERLPLHDLTNEVHQRE